MNPMNLFATTLRRGIVGTVGACAVGAAIVGVGVLPAANAAGPCSASGFAATSSGVLASAGTYLDAHPGADDVLTAAVSQSPEDARTSVRGYFIGHPGEFLDLQRITQPLKDLKNQCGVDVSPTQLATLFDELQ
jgi:hemophore-related protein